MTCDMDLKIISLMAILWPFAWCQLVPSCGLATDCKNCTIIRDCVWCRQPVSLFFFNANLNFKHDVNSFIYYRVSTGIDA